MVDVELLLEQAREIPAIPQATRARVITRVRTAIAVGLGMPFMHTPPRRTALYRVALVAAAVLVTGIAGAVASMHDWTPPVNSVEATANVRPPSPIASSAPSAPISSGAPLLAPAVPPEAPLNPAAPELHRAPKVATARESYAAELELLRRAQADYAAGNFSGSLVLLNAHARQFPNGRLAEECEALRVSCLKGLGRSTDARRAATSFAGRFPHSVLLPRTIAADPPENN